ncbi:MAG: response regulator [Coleofasciculaceae cyanobacterium]
MEPKQILIVDDEEDIRDVAKLALEMLGGWQVLTASSGSQGLLVAEQEQPDAILLDVMMPDMDGVTTFQKLQANPQTKNIPVILLTAKVQSADQRRFDNLGVKAVIAKPFKTMSLANQVAEILNWD